MALIDDNKFEVTVTPDDNNDIRFPNSVQPEPVRGDSAYGPGKWEMAKPTNLDAGDTAGVVGIPTIDVSGQGMEGTLAPSLNPNVDMTNSDTSLNTTASGENLSKKFKYPNVSQDIPAKGKPSVQYNDHT